MKKILLLIPLLIAAISCTNNQDQLARNDFVNDDTTKVAVKVDTTATSEWGK